MILTAGRLWDEAKNIGSLARLPRNSLWPIYAAGESTSPDNQTIRFEGLKWLGRLSKTELAHCLSRAAIFALPARYEPFGLAALEAGLAGCVLVLGDIPSLREIWRDAALFVPPDQADALSNTLERVIRDPALCSLMSKRARRRALTFSVERMARGYMDLYRRVLDTGSRFKVQGSSYEANRSANSA
jgi:glycogen(starch) synthase